MFEKATRMKLRFPTARGELTVEDLWEVPLRGKFSLDSIARSIFLELKGQADISFVDEKPTTNSKLELMLDIVKYIIGVKKEEAQKQEAIARNRTRAKQIDEIMRDKEVENLKSMSLEELMKIQNELQDEPTV